MYKKIRKYSLLILLVLILSFPRSLQEIKISIAFFLLILFLVEFKIKKNYIINILLLPFIYLIPFFNGIIQNNDIAFIIDGLKLYIIFPLMIYTIFQLYKIDQLSNYIYLSSKISIFIIVFVTLTTILNGLGILSYNLNILFYPEEDKIGFNTGYLHIINSQLSYLIFLIPVVFFKNFKFKLNDYKFILFLFLLIFCFLTGRRILMLPFIFILLNNFKKFFYFTIIISLLFYFLLSFNFFEIDLIIIWDRFVDAITSSGDSEVRGEQMVYFIEHIKSKPFFGYGIGSYMENYLRSYEFKTAYEITYLYYLFTFGIFGLSIVLSYYFILFKKSYLLCKISNDRKLYGILLGTFTLLIASFTNPYWLSSFDYCLPMAIMIKITDTKIV